MDKQCKLPQLSPVGRAMIASDELEQHLNEAEAKAHKNLSQYRFMNFGYWAAIWTRLNRIGKYNRPNPFAEYVKSARKTVHQNSSPREVIVERGWN